MQHPRANLSSEELKGLKWLEKMTQDNKLCVVPADKGGAILIVYPDLLRDRVLEKLNNPSLYLKLPNDPTHSLHQELFKLWVKGKENGLITAKDAKSIMGVSNNPKPDGSGPTNRPSTSPHFKPGRSYFYPSLKIHKLKKDELIPGVEPPVRLITALQDGVSKRSDVFIADRFLKDLEKDFCDDLLTDTTDALRWLENLNNELEPSEKKDLKCFTFDFKALYDSLSQDLVIESLKEAMTECRPDWSPEFCSWLISLIEMSMKSSIGVFEDSWFRQKSGVPTGGSLCVQLANIAVFAMMRKAVYSKPQLMEKVISVKRYIDDGAGGFEGTEEEFKDWLKEVNSNLVQFGLVIDESCIAPPDIYVPFLDVQFCFSSSGELQTDLYTKPTDSRSYLNFRSSHPSHIFSGIIFSQCLRLRRIINDQNRLKHRLDELKVCFRNAGYPMVMINNISNKVLQSERSLERKLRTDAEETPKTRSIRVVSTFGSDSDIVRSVKQFESALTRTRSFSLSDTLPASPTRSPVVSRAATPPPSYTSEQTRTNRLFQFVKKTGASIRSRVVKVKDLALGQRFGKTTPCKSKNCACCGMITDKESFTFNNNRVKTATGSCASYNVIYMVVCSICDKPYVGRTVRPLRTRIGEHRQHFYKIIKGEKFDLENDDFALGNHLYQHGFHERTDFNKVFNVVILEVCSPKVLDVKEHQFIHKLTSLVPQGINLSNPFSIPLLHK